MMNTILNEYKSTPIGLIPNNWEVKKLGELGKTISGLTYQPSDISVDQGVLVLRSSNIQNRTLSFDDNVFVKVSPKGFNPVKRNDILICVRNGSRSLIGKSALISEEVEGVAFGAFMAIFRGDTNDYLFHVLDTSFFYKEIQKNLGATINSINGSDLKLIKIPFPPSDERKEIVRVLNIMDENITKTNILISKKELQKKWLCDKLLSGKTKIPGIQAKKWQRKKLDECLIYSPREIQKPSSSFFALGIRSHGKGIFHKNDFDPEDLAMDVLYEVKENDLVVNITFAWEHAIAIANKNDDGGLVSHRFPTYTFNTATAIPEFFKYLILQKRFKYQLELISPGGAGRNRVMSKKDFPKIEVLIPEVEEQRAIANILDCASKEIQILKAKADKLKEQKKGMMQLLLTGKKRLI